MHSIGLIDEERLLLIPPKYWKMHEFCFLLHDRLAQLLIEYESSGVHNVVIDSFKQAISGHESEFEDVDILEFMKNNNLVEPYKHHLVSHILLALTSDMLHFIYESLCCFEKRKFSVGFTLLRKPLKEHLLFHSWLLADEDDFIKRFEAKNYKTLNKVTKERRIEIFEGAINKLAVADAFNSELIWDMLYSKTCVNGFEPTWQRATHLITSYGDLLKTEDYSLNFIFEDSSDDYYYQFLYSKLPYLLLFVTQVLFENFNRLRAINKLTFSHSVLTTMGCYEALFLDGKSQHITKMLKRHLKDFLKCIHCKQPLKITKKNAPEFYLTERVICKSCGLQSEFPLYWMFSMAKVSINRD